jgi:hypothetical protein
MADERATLLRRIMRERLHKGGLPDSGFTGYEGDPALSSQRTPVPTRDTCPLILTPHDPAGRFRRTYGGVRLSDGSNEAVPTPMNSLDEPRYVRIIPEGLAEFPYGRRQHGVGDGGVRPGARQQVILRDELSRPAHQQLQHGKSLVTQADGCLTMPQPLIQHVEAEWSE